MGIYEGVCRFTLSALHCSAWVKRCLSVTILWIWTGIAYAIYNKGTKLECIQRDADDLKKIPSHLAIIVRNKKEKLSLDELSRMVVWAFAAGVRTVSLYHPNGEFIWSRLSEWGLGCVCVCVGGGGGVMA